MASQIERMTEEWKEAAADFDYRQEHSTLEDIDEGHISTEEYGEEEGEEADEE